MSILEKNTKKLDKILKETMKETPDGFIYLGVINPTTGLPIIEKKEKNFKEELYGSTTIFGALATGVLQTGEFVSNNTGFLSSQHFLEVMVRGESAHSVFLRIAPIFSKEDFILVGMSIDNNGLAHTTRILRAIAKQISSQLLSKEN